MKIMDLSCWIAFVLVALAGMDCGIYGIFRFHLIEVIAGSGFAGRMLEILTGIATVYLFSRLFSKKEPMP